ncbi:CRISPR-associated endonuclease Cas2 [Martelella lutilitoris]|uniref:CRISPR-associated endoribonuclease Cas2 n=1 Tax=Martelella lutilitoris TaxID=2583532 RepID=A0A5C4JPG4_9HYPH|nr:CRISPR-associated endonuclease Cas2 [Martelella lutilitoris]TNB47102.1 CRISPR-associated endonuclease Cas2 [Martelella lutilitoris]
MPEQRHFTVFSYDISDDRKRRNVAAILEDHAVRVQFSVFEAFLTHQQCQALAERLERRLDRGDSLRVYVVTATGLKHSRSFGGPAIVDDSAPFLLF